MRDRQCERTRHAAHNCNESELTLPPVARLCSQECNQRAPRDPQLHTTAKAPSEQTTDAWPNIYYIEGIFIKQRLSRIQIS